jgi:hypothetical protein
MHHLEKLQTFVKAHAAAESIGAIRAEVSRR